MDNNQNNPNLEAIPLYVNLDTNYIKGKLDNIKTVFEEQCDQELSYQDILLIAIDFLHDKLNYSSMDSEYDMIVRSNILKLYKYCLPGMWDSENGDAVDIYNMVV